MEEINMNRRLLVTEDDPLLMALYKRSLKELDGFDITYAPSLEDARKLLATDQFDLALLDLNLASAHGREGLELLTDLRRTQHSTVVMMSSDDDEDTIAECTRRGALAFIPKHTGFARRLPDVVRQAVTA